MASNLDRYHRDLDALVKTGNDLLHAMQAETVPEEFKKAVSKHAENNEEFVKQFLKTLPSFKRTYQRWYSEAKALVRQLLPDRLSDFVSHYEKPKSRKEINYSNYKIEDYLQDLRVTRTHGYETTTLVAPDAAVPQFRQQLAILEAAKARFESSLFDIRLLVQADILDSEIDVAEEGAGPALPCRC